MGSGFVHFRDYFGCFLILLALGQYTQVDITLGQKNQKTVQKNQKIDRSCIR